MRTASQSLSAMLFLMSAALPAVAQSAAQSVPPAALPATGSVVAAPVTPTATPDIAAASSTAAAAPTTVAAPAVPASIAPLLAFRDSEIKFPLVSLMDLLRDHRHEGWVLAAYPDPKTSRPLIGAGFSLDLPERDHPQTDPLNMHTFVEPSSAQLWRAAGLSPALLAQVLEEFHSQLGHYRTARRYRKRIWILDPQITSEEATALLRISAIQAVENARAWCRNFDELSGPQQMAISQLVYQMGVNLGEFGTFLSLINNDPAAPGTATAVADALPDSAAVLAEASPAAVAANPPAAASEHWRDVQESLVHSQWARLYRVRATAVIAMLDPEYEADPVASEQRIAAVLRPTAHRRRGHSSLHSASYRRHGSATVAGKTATAHGKQKA